jgi:diguanylate cyclase (GGDEF)-like protein
MQINQDSQIKIEHQCSASIGIVLFKDHDATQDNLLKWADMAMYQAKEAGGNTIQFYEEIALITE